MALTPAQARAINILTAEGGEATRDVLTTEGGIRTTTINALARRGLIEIDGPWITYAGEKTAPIYPVAGGGYMWRHTCGSRGSGATLLEASDWRNSHLRSCR